MKGIAWLMSGLAAVATAAAGEPAPITNRPAARYDVTGPEKKNGIETFVVTSDYQPQPANLYVLLPDGFATTNRYKVLYVLPAWQRSRDGIDEVKKQNLANKHNIICAGPDFCTMPWYVDNPTNSRIRYDSYLPDVIVPFIDKTYPTIAAPEGRLVMGFSKSGGGAVSLLLRHPEVFGRAGSWDGSVMADNRPEFYGTKQDFAHYYIPNLLAERADMLRDKPARIAITGLGFGGTVRAHALMNELRIPHYCDDTLRGSHDWKSGWLPPLVDILMSADMLKAKEMKQ